MEEYLTNWAKYLEANFSQPKITTSTHTPNIHTSEAQDGPITNSKVDHAIQKLKNHKAAGFDEITYEDVKLVNKLKPGLVRNILQECWQNERSPENFHKSLLHLFQKPAHPGSRRDYRFQKNHRPISLLVTMRKVYEIILSKRILSHVSLSHTQFGFQPGKSTTDCIFLLIEAIQECRSMSIYSARSKGG